MVINVMSNILASYLDENFVMGTNKTVFSYDPFTNGEKRGATVFMPTVCRSVTVNVSCEASMATPSFAAEIKNTISISGLF